MYPKVIGEDAAPRTIKEPPAGTDGFGFGASTVQCEYFGIFLALRFGLLSLSITLSPIARYRGAREEKMEALGTMPKFYSTKKYDGFSTVFRQWSAEDTHCRFLHGYGVSINLCFEGELDTRNWVWDFGGFSRATSKIDDMSPKTWLNYMFDHTIVVAEDDPSIDTFLKMEADGIAQVRIVPAVGAERFAQYLYEKINPFVVAETNGRVRLCRVEFSEHDKNSAIYEP